MSKDKQPSLDKLSPFELYPYASWTYFNKFKRHKSRAYAMSAITNYEDRWRGRTMPFNYGPGKLYEWQGVIGEGGSWVEIPRP